MIDLDLINMHGRLYVKQLGLRTHCMPRRWYHQAAPSTKSESPQSSKNSWQEVRNFGQRKPRAKRLNNLPCSSIFHTGKSQNHGTQKPLNWSSNHQF